MRFRSIVFPLAFACSPLGAEGPLQPPIVTTGLVSSETNINQRAMEVVEAAPAGVPAGAVYEVRLRVPYKDVDGYLADYARWFLPVDQYECNKAKYPTSCESSGRKLLSVLTREHGDQFNLVFMYKYESPYKEYYYCKYQKAFFQYHVDKRTSQFDQHYRAVLAERKSPLNANADAFAFAATTLRDAFPAGCSVKAAADAKSTEQQRAALDVARETIRKFDLSFASRVQLDEGAWYFDVNVCKVAELKDDPAIADQNTTKNGQIVEGLSVKCKPRRSMLERAVEDLSWP